MRTAIMAILREMGIPEVRLVASSIELRDVLKTGNIDLLVVNYNFDEGEGQTIARELRFDRFGDASNPFVTIVMTSWESGDAPVRAALSAGVDDLLMFPLPMGTLRKRLQVLAERRKPFIVTSDYVGPERRKDPQRPSEIPHFEPPNTFGRRMAGEQVSMGEIRQTVNSMRGSVNAEKVRRDAFQVAFLSRVIAEDYRSGVPFEKLKTRLDRLADLAGEIIDRGTEEQVNALQTMIDTLTSTIEATDENTGDDALNRTIRLLEPISQGIVLTIRQSDDEASLAGEISRTVAAFRERTKQRREDAEPNSTENRSAGNQ